MIRLLILALLVGVWVMVSACRRGGEPGTLVIAIEQPPRGFDPRFSTVNSKSARIMQLIYDTLVVKNERFEFVPALAERFDEDKDHTTFTFHLRSGVRFHNGKLLTSADVKHTFQSLTSPELRSPIRGLLDKISAIDTPDESTVVFRAREPFYSFIGNLPAIGIIPEGAGVEMINAPIGTGPYRFLSYSEGDRVRLEANEEYWGGAPHIQRVDIAVIQDNSTRQAALISGEVDLAYNAEFDPETNMALNGRHGLRVIPENGTNIAHLGVNLTSAILANQKVRQAISYALDREAIIHRLLRDQARRADSILPPEQWAFEPEVISYNYDTARASSLLDEAGFRDPDGNGPKPRFTIVLMTLTSQLSRNIAAIIQEQLGRVGIEVDLQSLESATFFDKIEKAQFDLYYLISVGGNQSTDIFQFVYHSRYRNTEFNDLIARLRAARGGEQIAQILSRLTAILGKRDYCPNPQVIQLYERADAASELHEARDLYLRIASMLTDGGGANRSRFCDPQLDSLIVEAEQTNERETKKEIYSRIQKMISESLPQIYLWYPANILIARERVTNIRIEPSGSWYFITALMLEK